MGGCSGSRAATTPRSTRSARGPGASSSGSRSAASRTACACIRSPGAIHSATPGSSADELAGVQLVEEAVVLVVHDAPLDLERGRQLAGLLREIVVEERELLDLLDLRILRVD